MDDYLLKYHHKSFPVVKDGALYAMIALSDVKLIPVKDWPVIQVGSIAAKDIIVALPDQSLAEVSELMSKHDVDRIPIVEPNQPDKIIGIIASTDIIRLEELSDLIEA